jgi:flagellar basal-body rod protein FlgC
MPGHPLADDEGFIYTPAIDRAQETANMMDASQGYKSSVEAINTTKALIMRTLTIGR